MEDIQQNSQENTQQSIQSQVVMQKEMQQINLTPIVKENIISSTKWGKFFSIICYISAGLCLIFAIVMFVSKSLLTTTSEFDYADYQTINTSSIANIGSIAAGIIYLIVAAFSFAYGYLIMKTSNKIKSGIEQNNQDDIAEGTHTLKTFLQFAGIITIICFAATLISIIGSVLVALAI